MNVDFMRFVDRFVGIPLCGMLSLLERCRRLISRKRREGIRKILVIQLSEMGSALLAQPSLRFVRNKLPDAEITYLIFAEMQESLSLLPVIPEKNVLTIASRTLWGFFRDTLRVILAMRKIGFDATIDLELFSRFSAILGFMSGAGIRVGFDNFHAEGLYRGSLITHRVPYNCYNHISVNFFALFKSLFHDPSDIPLGKERIDPREIGWETVSAGEAEKRSLLEKLLRECPGIGAPRSKLIILNPNASNLLPLRRWPLENYILLARRLLAHPDHYVLLTGVKSELPDALAIHSAVQSSRCINLAGRTTLRELIALYDIAQVLVSNDSAPPHFASLTRIRIIVLFGPETPLLYAPLSKNAEVVWLGLACSPCVSAFSHRKSACTNNLCLKRISVEEIHRRVEEYLLSTDRPERQAEGSR